MKLKSISNTNQRKQNHSIPETTITSTKQSNSTLYQKRKTPGKFSNKQGYQSINLPGRSCIVTAINWASIHAGAGERRGNAGISPCNGNWIGFGEEEMGMGR